MNFAQHASKEEDGPVQPSLPQISLPPSLLAMPASINQNLPSALPFPLVACSSSQQQFLLREAGPYGRRWGGMES